MGPALSGMLLSTDLDPAQLRAIEATGGPTVVSGAPGTGKTTVVVERVARLLNSGMDRERLLVAALSRHSVAELTKRLVARLGASAPTVTTLHALALGLVRRNHRQAGYRRPPRALAARESWRRLKTALAAEDPAAWPRYGKMLHSQSLLALVNDLIIGAAHNGLSREELLGLMAAHGRADFEELIAFQARYQSALKESGLIDVNWALVEAVQLLESQPRLLAEQRARYDQLVIDEFEEATHTQARLASLLGGDGLFVAGGPDESISSFLGSSPSHLLEIAESARSSITLERAYRSPRPIEDACRRLLGQAEKETAEDGSGSDGSGPDRSGLDGDRPDSSAPIGSGPDGTILLSTLSHQNEEAEWIAGEIASLLRSGVGAGQITVLTRSGNDPVARELSRRLHRLGVPVFDGRGPSAVAADPLVSSAIELLRFLTADPEARDPLFARLLSSPLSDITTAELRQIRRSAREMGVSLLDLSTDAAAIAALPPHLASAVAAMTSRLRSLESASVQGLPGLLWQIWVSFPAFAASATGVAGEQQSGSPSAYRAFIEETKRIVRDGPSTTVEDLVRLWDTGHFGEVAAPAYGNGAGGVTISTIHRARGREWDFVFLPDLVEGVLPLRRSPVGSLAPLLLRRNRGEAPGIREQHLEEEKRLLVVGLSRARRRVYLSCSGTALNGTTRLSPSRYLGVLSGTEGCGRDRDGEWIESLVACYRRQLRSSDQLQLAQALYALGRLAERFPDRVDPSIWWDTQEETDGADPPYPDGSLYLSASRLNGYRSCPLQYKFAQHLSLEDVGNDAMTLGTLIHDTLEEYHKPGSEIPRTREALEELVEKRFDAAAFSHPAIARQVRKRATELLDKYYPRYGRAAGVVSVETQFRFALGPHTISGRIDRMDRRGEDGLELIDYKTGSPMSKADAEDDIQLALYDLAFQHTPELAKLGRPEQATYLYIKSIGPRADGKRSYQPSEQGRRKLLDRIERYSQGILSESFPSRFHILDVWKDLEPEEIEKIRKSQGCRFCGFAWLCPEMERGLSDE